MNIKQITAAIAWILGAAVSATTLYVFSITYLREERSVQVIDFQVEQGVFPDTTDMPVELKLPLSDDARSAREAWLTGKPNIAHERALLKMRFTNTTDRFDSPHSVAFWAKNGAPLPQSLPSVCFPHEVGAISGSPPEYIPPGEMREYNCTTAWLPVSEGAKTDIDGGSIFASGPVRQMINEACMISVSLRKNLNPPGGDPKLYLYTSGSRANSCQHQ